MNITENGSNLITIARDLVLQSDSASYQRGIIEMLANYFEVDYTEAVDLIHDTQKFPPENEHIILVAFHTSGQNDMESAQRRLMEHLPNPADKDNDIEEWWIAMDERYEPSDNDSAVFVEGSGRAAWERYHKQAGTKGFEISRPISYETLADVQGFKFDNRLDGQNFIDAMNRNMATFGYVTVGDARQLLGLSARFGSDRLAWNQRLTYACLRPVMYMRHNLLDLPTPTHKV